KQHGFREPSCRYQRKCIAQVKVRDTAISTGTYVMNAKAASRFRDTVEDPGYEMHVSLAIHVVSTDSVALQSAELCPDFELDLIQHRRPSVHRQRKKQGC